MVITSNKIKSQHFFLYKQKLYKAVSFFTLAFALQADNFHINDIIKSILRSVS